MARILIAEDDESMRNFLSLALEKAGHDVLACADGQDALTLLLSEKQAGTPPDLLLADIVMPGMDGIALSRQAKEALPEIKILYITGFAAVAPKQKPRKDGPAPQVLSKPFHLKDLVARVETLLAA